MSLILENQTGYEYFLLVSNRMILSAINEKITSHKKEKAPKSYRVRNDFMPFFLTSYFFVN